MVLLDTNHCSYAILGNTQVLDRLATLGDERITTCTIVKGELINMAARARAATDESCPDSTLSGWAIHLPNRRNHAEFYGNLKAAVFDRYAPLIQSPTP